MSSFFKKLFSSSKSQDADQQRPEKEQPKKSLSVPSSDGSGGTGSVGGGGKKGHTANKQGNRGARASVPAVKVDPPADDASAGKRKVSRPGSAGSKPTRQQTTGQRQKRLSRKKQKKGAKGDVAPADPNKRLEFPTTPEMILAIHKRKPFLNKNEEWLVVELNEFECLVENLDIIKVIAEHSKFFEVEPDELWEEFFEFVEDMPSYDEMINYDVWQEFRDEKYPC